MKGRHITTRRALTIVEAMIAAVVLVIAVIGTSVFRYQSALGARHTDLYTTGVRMTLLLCEGWAGADGNNTYNPVSTFRPELDIISRAAIGAPTGFTELGSYQIIVDGVSFYATLSYKNMGSGLKSLHVVVRWDPSNRGLTAAKQSFQLTTYAKPPL
jgi:hypothetical protein